MPLTSAERELGENWRAEAAGGGGGAPPHTEIMINFDEIKKILDMMREHELSEFEFERDGLRVRLKKDTAPFGPASGPASAHPAPAATPAPPGAAATTPGAGRAGVESGQLELAIVKSPIVGTFYRSPEPAAPPFVEVGSFVRKGQVLCIIEAMKLMNEIDSEYDGAIVSVFVENGQPVQYGERLFAIKTA